MSLLDIFKFSLLIFIGQKAIKVIYQEVFTQHVREMQGRKEAGLPMASWVKLG